MGSECPRTSAAKITSAAMSSATSGGFRVWLSGLPASVKLATVGAVGLIVLLTRSSGTIPLLPSVDEEVAPGNKNSISGSTAAIGKSRARAHGRGAHSTATESSEPEQTWNIQFVSDDTGEPIPYFNFRRYWVEGDGIGRSGELKADENGMSDLIFSAPASPTSLSTR